MWWISHKPLGSLGYFFQTAYFTGFLWSSNPIWATAAHSIWINHLVVFRRKSKDSKMHWFWNSSRYLLQVNQRTTVGNVSCNHLAIIQYIWYSQAIFCLTVFDTSYQRQESKCENTPKYCLKMATEEFRCWTRATSSSNKANARRFQWSGDLHSCMYFLIKTKS